MWSRIFRKLAGIRAEESGADGTITTAHPPGHFYSPIVDPESIKPREADIWGSSSEVLGIDFNDDQHKMVLEEIFPRHIGNYDYPDDLEETAYLSSYFSHNSQFGWLDSRTLFVLLGFLKPKRIVEVGGGFSTLLTADVNHRFLHDTARFSCIEPYPRDFLKKPLPGLSELLVDKVESLPLSFFSGLGKGDVLFIDSSHVSKTGSDLNYLVFEILPRLNPGVLIHFHDIFLPREYPRQWVVDENRSWNEQYLVRALLMYSSAFKIFFSSAYAYFKYPTLVERALGLEENRGFGGSSLWIERL